MLSIIVPCYNDEKLLSRCFECILKQTTLPEEIIFVDNNSTDKSLEIATIFLSKFKKKGIDLKIISEPDRSMRQSSARLTGFKAVSKDLVGMIDVDTQIDKYWVELAKKVFAKNENIVGITGRTIYTNDRWLRKLNLFFLSFLWSIIPYSFVLWGCNSVISKKAFDNIGGLDGYAKFHKKFNLKYIYDDNYLSEKLKSVGKLKFVWNLKVKALEKGGGQRVKDQNKNFWLIKKYLKNEK